MGGACPKISEEEATESEQIFHKKIMSKAKEKP